jgi:hypothetical protein
MVTREPLQRLVVKKHRNAVLGDVHVTLENVGTRRESGSEAAERVFTEARHVASV